MKIPLSWMRDFVDIDLTLEELAHRLTMTGLEVDEIRLVGLPMPEGDRRQFKITGSSWCPETIVVAQIDEVMPHPNADRLVLCRLNDGLQELIVLTGAPNLYPYQGQGALPKPIKVAYAREGARIYDGHQPGQVMTTLKRAKIRGVESFSMVCSEKELGISDEHEGVILLDDDAPTGKPLVEYMGDAVFEISILPNMIRNASVLGVAREIAAFSGKRLRKPGLTLPANGESVEGQVSILIQQPELNPRFVLGLVRGVTAAPSPYWVQRRLRLAGMRPINSVVDATNYIMLETGQPLHAFDYDRLVQRAGNKPPTIITRTANPGEQLKTLDGVERTLDDFTVLVTDTAGALSLAGVMGGSDSEVAEQTRNVLLEGAAWNFINTRRTMTAQRLHSEAAYRFSRGVHPELARLGVELGLERICQWSGGEIAAGLVDEYPQVVEDPLISLTPADVRRWLGIELTPQAISRILARLEFECQIEGERVDARVPPHRLDIGRGMIGMADVLEEIARIYGYENIPATRLADALPPQRSNPNLDAEDRLRDALARVGLQEVITYRLTSPEREARALPLGVPLQNAEYVCLQNPIAADRCVMRRSLLPSLLETLERNSHLRDRLAVFEIGAVYLPQPGETLPAEPLRLGIALTGLHSLPEWDQPGRRNFDFFDLRGILEAGLESLHIPEFQVTPGEHPSFHPGKCGYIQAGDQQIGVFGELHPLVKERYDIGGAAVLAAELDLSALLRVVPSRFEIQPVSLFPPVLEDIAVIVDEERSAGEVIAVIEKAGGDLLAGVRLFDIYRGGQIGEAKKSLAFNLTYQAADRTLTDLEAAKVRQRIVGALDTELGAKLRS